MGRTVRDAMTRQVITVHPNTPFKQIVQVLVENGIDAVPVVDEGGRLLGVVSGSDLTCHEEQPASLTTLIAGRTARAHARKAKAGTARALMTAPARTIDPDAAVCVALHDMGRFGVGRLIVTENDAPVGILTRTDLLRVFLRSDEDLERDVEAAVHRAVGEPLDVVVTVADGVAVLRGHVDRASTACAAAAAARSIPGVVDVEDQLHHALDDLVVPMGFSGA